MGIRIFNKNISTGQLQVAIWVSISVLDFFSNLQYNPAGKALSYSLLEMLFYAYIICVNTYWLIPHFYFRAKTTTYILLLILLLVTAIIFGSMGSAYLMEMYYPGRAGNLSVKIFAYHTFSAILIFLFSVLYRLALDYFVLIKKQGEIKAEKVQTELHLLKQQVHPHFLFNTLNNIYYVAQNGSPQAAELIARLSDIMRYFIEESKKDKVFLKDEVELLKSYIELESIRMRYEMPVDFRINGDTKEIRIPPLLLLPIVENIFKHGVNKRSQNNFAEINLTIQEGRLLFRTRNGYHPADITNTGGKTGLVNLEKRLRLYYEHDYQLDTQKLDDIFKVSLQIKLYEN
jgi:sensor histidine kinase YesM